MGLLPVEEARSRILRGVKPLPAESVTLEEAQGRILARPVRATRHQPPFDASAMDGYAGLASDLTSTPVSLKVQAVLVAPPTLTIRLSGLGRVMGRTCGWPAP